MRGPLAAELPPSDAELVYQLKFAPELGAGDFPSEELAILEDGALDFFGRLVQELDSETASAEFAEAVEEFRAGLGLGVEDGISATGVGF